MKWFNWSELFDDAKLAFGKPNDDDEDEEDDDEDEVLDDAAAAATAFKY